MKKTISWMIFLILIMSVVAFPPMPMPFRGRVLIDGQGLSGYNVEVSCDGQSVNIKTENGIYFTDMSALSSYNQGDSITVTFGAETRTVTPTDFPYVVDAISVGEAPDQLDEPEEETLKVTSNSDKSAASVDVLYGQGINLKVGNNKIAKLIDGEIEFNDEDYNVREEIFINGKIETSLDDVDYGLTPYFVISDIGINYIFEDLIDLNEITEEETLTIIFAGKEYEIIDAKTSEITYLTSDKKDVTQGETIQINDKDFKIIEIEDEFIRISYDGVIENIINKLCSMLNYRILN